MRQRSPLSVFLPNQIVAPATFWIMVGVQAALVVLFWTLSPFKVLPRPMEVFAAFPALLSARDAGGVVEFPRAVAGSFTLFFQALGLTTLFSLALAYLTVLPFFRPIVAAVTKGRFLSLVGFSVVFTLLFDGDGAKVKLAMVVLGGTTFLLTSTADVVAQIPKSQFDHARTLRMGEWRVVWEVVVLGTADKMLDAIRQNAAMLWAILPVIETMFRSEYGLGLLLDVERKYFHLDKVYAIQLTFVGIGLLQDYLIGLVRSLLCPYADLTKERPG